MKQFLIVMIFGLLTSLAIGQTKQVEIQTSAKCGDCKGRIENALNYTKGVKFAELDMATKKVTVKFKSSKITLDEIKEVLANTGYDADEVKAKPEAVEKLPSCCKPGVKEH